MWIVNVNEARYTAILKFSIAETIYRQIVVLKVKKHNLRIEKIFIVWNMFPCNKSNVTANVTKAKVLIEGLKN